MFNYAQGLTPQTVKLLKCMPIVCPTITSSILATNTIIDVLRFGSYQLEKNLLP